MTIRNTLYVIACLFLCATQGKAQEKKWCNQHYVDLAFGTEFNTSSYQKPIGEIAFQGKQRISLNLTLKYQYFFHKHWGIFLDLHGSATSHYSQESLIKKMEMTKDMQPHYYYTYTGIMNKEDYEDGFIHGVYAIGAMYRRDINSWSLRPYISLGYTFYSPNIIDYLRKEEGSNQVEHIKVTFGNGKEDQHGYCITPGLYVSKAIASIVYLTAELSYTIHPKTFTGHYQRSNKYTHEILEQYKIREKAGNYLTINLGMSIRIAKSTPKP